MSDPTYPCPCCGYVTFVAPPGGDEACAICFWEDDPVQLRWPRQEGGTNSVSLEQAQRNFAECGACEESYKTAVRPLTAGDRRETGWRPVGDEDTFEDESSEDAGPADPTALYWWRDTYWRRN